MARISVVGAGYVGIVTAACLAHRNHDVTCIDIDVDKIRRLRRGQIPIHEPGLDELVHKGLASRRLRFSADIEDSVPTSDFVFVAVQTPGSTNGDVDLAPLMSAVHGLSPLLKECAVIVQKSTAPMGTAHRIEQLIPSRNGVSPAVVANPEFLRMGTAVRDFMQPDRVILGSRNRDAALRVAGLYDFTDCQVIITDPDTAEMIKYASNAFLAAKVSFINEIAEICEVFGVNVQDVAAGMGHDPRIGKDYLKAGLGWGGSCLPKDVQALIQMARAAAVRPALLEAVQGVNQAQNSRALAKLEEMIGDVEGAVVGLLGLAFKPATDDLRSAPSLRLAKALLDRGAQVRAYDPVAMERARQRAPEIDYCSDPYELSRGADALILVTEWPEFAELDMEAIRGYMQQPVILDGRNFFAGDRLRDLGYSYAGFGARAGEVSPKLPLTSVLSGERIA